MCHTLEYSGQAQGTLTSAPLCGASRLVIVFFCSSSRVSSRILALTARHLGLTTGGLAFLRLLFYQQAFMHELSTTRWG